MSLTKTFVVLVVLMVCGASAFAGGYKIGEHGARAMGMGGAFVAMPRDASAIYHNPAGLSFLEGANILVGSTLIAPSTTFTGPTPSTASTDMVSQTFFPSNLYVTYTMQNGLAFGLGVFSPYALGTEWAGNWVGRHLSVKSGLKTFYINPTISYKVSDQLSLGVGASYVLGSVVLERKLPLIPLPDGTFKLEGKGTGINFNAGIIWKPTEAISVGLTYRAETKIEFDGDATFGSIPNIDPDGPGPIPVLTALFPSGTTGKATLAMPSNLAGGIAYDVNQDLSIQAAVEFVGWSSYDKLEVSFDKPVAGSKTMVEIADWKNSILIRVGGEYRIDKLALRAGFIYDETPQPEKSVGPVLPDADRMEFSLGLGYRLTNTVDLDIAYQYVKGSDRTVTAPTNSFPGTYKSSASLFGLSLGFHF
ncbi:MAG: hypothetical protein HW389_1615 [Bacteroidetes bacterium]|nr:hypothetical protein [Bacteroidota bacterium]